MRLAIDCDGVLRDFIGSVKRVVARECPEYKDQLDKLPENWDFITWLTFWTEEEAEDFIFVKHYYDIFVNADPYPEAIEDWPILKEWSVKNNHDLVLVSAQRNQTVNATSEWIGINKFDFRELHYIREKWRVDVDILVDDNMKKLKSFKEKSVASGDATCFKQPWNTELHNSYWTIDRLSDIIDLVENRL